jgi:hypothetical protein
MERVFVVLLRRPKSEPDEMRTDPFWEYGSFGLTGCHEHNLMNSNSYEKLRGARFAFAQGGHNGFKLVYLTPRLNPILHNRTVEVRWKPISMPFRYLTAPLLIDNNGNTDFQFIKNIISNVECKTSMGKFSSKFRSRATPLSSEQSNAIIHIYSGIRKCKRLGLANSYIDTLPYPPPLVDKNRRRTYKKLFEEPRECFTISMQDN